MNKKQVLWLHLEGDFTAAFHTCTLVLSHVNISLMENKDKGPLFSRSFTVGWFIGNKLHDSLQEKQIHSKLCRIYLLIKEASNF